MKADYTGGIDNPCCYWDGDHRQMKADYTPIDNTAVVNRDGDHRQMKADYTQPFRLESLMARWRSPPNEGGLHDSD